MPREAEVIIAAPDFMTGEYVHIHYEPHYIECSLLRLERPAWNRLLANSNSFYLDSLNLLDIGLHGVDTAFIEFPKLIIEGDQCIELDLNERFDAQNAEAVLNLNLSRGTLELEEGRPRDCVLKRVNNPYFLSAEIEDLDGYQVTVIEPDSSQVIFWSSAFISEAYESCLDSIVQDHVLSKTTVRSGPFKS